MQKRWDVFVSAVFFVLGFSVIFSLVGVLLQSVLSSVSYSAQQWLGRIGGVIIILFGLYLIGLLKLSFLEREYKFKAVKLKSKYLTSFVFGAAFAVGWTPCVGAVLGAVLTLAITQPGQAFFLLLSYSLGLGLPFLIVGLFVNKARAWIERSARVVKYLSLFFGVVLILMGILVFTNQLSRVANLAFAADFLLALDVGVSAMSLNLGIAFFAGLVSFLSPCVLPLIPAFLSYLASVRVGDEQK